MKTDGRWLFIHQEDEDENLYALKVSILFFFVSVALKKARVFVPDKYFKCLRVKPEAYLRG
jgi:hypothetical protein